MIEAALGALAAGRIPPTIAEPAEDIAAQVAALRDPRHPKAAVFVATGTALPDDTSGLIVVRRDAGTLLTTDWIKAALFATGGDDEMALVLDYPETKRSALASGNPRVIQVRDAHGRVIQEATVSPRMVAVARVMFEPFRPDGGEMVEIGPVEAIERRLKGRARIPGAGSR